MDNLQWAVILLPLYLIILLIIGLFASRATKKELVDYFLANRSLGPLLTTLAVSATVLSSFAMLGMAGAAYGLGYGGFQMIMQFGLFMVPFVLIVVLYPCWAISKVFGYTTQGEVFGGRWKNGKVVSIIYAVLLLYYILPNLIFGVLGSAIGIEQLTGGVVPYFWAGAMVALVTIAYTAMAGMRGTVWTDVFQAGLVLIAFIILIVIVPTSAGGLHAITEKLSTESPHLLSRAINPAFTWQTWLAFAFLSPLAIAMFPHSYFRVISAKNPKTIIIAASLFSIATWFAFQSSTLLGIWGKALIPNLEGKAVDNIVPILMSNYLPPGLFVIGLIGMLAIIKSTLDSQLLAASHIVTEDIINKYFSIKPEIVLMLGKLIIVLWGTFAFGGALIRPGVILDIVVYANAGVAVLLPGAFATLYWYRATKEGVLASVIIPTIILHLLQFKLIPSGGFNPVVPSFALAVILIIGVSLFTPVQMDNTEKYMKIVRGLYLPKEKQQKPSNQNISHV